MKNIITIPLVCLCAWVVAVEAAEPLKDPRLRDEDISMTMVTVEVARNAAGHYVYAYDIDAPISNLGKVLTFGVDISCESKPDARGFDASDYPRNPALRVQNFSEDGKHVPVAVDAPTGQAAIVTIAVNNGVGWAVGVEPGGVSRGLTIISPYPPGSRVYTLIPSIRYKEEQWDYSGVEEEDPEVPWLEDWIVTGVITGPACPGEEYPDGGDDGDMRIAIPGLVRITHDNAPLAFADKGTCPKHDPKPHWLTPNTRSRVMALAWIYHLQTGRLLSMNDGSLPLGGVIANQNGQGRDSFCHGSHRQGIDVDFNSEDRLVGPPENEPVGKNMRSGEIMLQGRTVTLLDYLTYWVGRMGGGRIEEEPIHYRFPN